MNMLLNIIRTVLGLPLVLLVWPAALLTCVVMYIGLFIFSVPWDQEEKRMAKIYSTIPWYFLKRIWAF